MSPAVSNNLKKKTAQCERFINYINCPQLH